MIGFEKDPYALFGLNDLDPCRLPGEHGPRHIDDASEVGVFCRIEVKLCLPAVWRKAVSGVSTPPGFQREIGVKAQGSSRSISEAGWPLAMASSVAFR